MTSDSLQSFIFEGHDVRGRLVRLQESIQAIILQHNYPPVIHTILGELLTATVLLSSSFKYDGQLTIQFQSEGPLRMLVAKCNHHLEIRGLAQWDHTATEQMLQETFFSGRLIVTVENLSDNHRYQSIIEINQKTIAEALEQYFQQSEQIPTKLVMTNHQKQFVGFLVQKMPSHNVEELAFWQHVEILTNTLKSDELLQWNNQRLLKNLFCEENVRLFDHQPVLFKCTCSQEKSKNTLCLLGREEVLNYFLTNKRLTMTCDYCDQTYEFTKPEAEQLFH
ncbi:MAG: Hsp33 family molecular chaperone HslO [Gammaproteobacteria bacterium]|nr:Hsp33 family molecular chaperone HslO [Gammaproteobacteria bacterium]